MGACFIPPFVTVDYTIKGDKGIKPTKGGHGGYGGLGGKPGQLLIAPLKQHTIEFSVSNTNGNIFRSK